MGEQARYGSLDAANAERGHFDEAAAIEGESLSFGRKLRNGSRILVHIMIGSIIEKGALTNVQTPIERYPDSVVSFHAIGGLIQAPTLEWEDLERGLLNGISFFQTNLSGPPFGPGLKNRVLANLCVPLFNPNASVRIYHDYLMALVDAGGRGDPAAAQRQEDVREKEKKRLRFKNGMGYRAIDLVTPKVSHVIVEMDEIIDIRAKVANMLQAAVSGNRKLR